MPPINDESADALVCHLNDAIARCQQALGDEGEINALMELVGEDPDAEPLLDDLEDEQDSRWALTDAAFRDVRMTIRALLRRRGGQMALVRLGAKAAGHARADDTLGDIAEDVIAHARPATP